MYSRLSTFQVFFQVLLYKLYFQLPQNVINIDE